MKDSRAQTRENPDINNGTGFTLEFTPAPYGAGAGMTA
jgi:hypothetical protein